MLYPAHGGDDRFAHERRPVVRNVKRIDADRREDDAVFALYSVRDPSADDVDPVGAPRVGDLDIDRTDQKIGPVTVKDQIVRAAYSVFLADRFLDRAGEVA